jgi:hypothetical protein
MKQNEFAAFRVLHEAMPLTKKAIKLKCSCLTWFLNHPSLPLERVERLLALYKMEMMS